MALYDPYNLQRFIDKHKDSFDKAMVEIKSGCKKSCWAWWIFPTLQLVINGQVVGSLNNKMYALKSEEEALAFLSFNDGVTHLGINTLNIFVVVKQKLADGVPSIILLGTDVSRLLSSAKLFKHISFKECPENKDKLQTLQWTNMLHKLRDISSDIIEHLNRETAAPSGLPTSLKKFVYRVGSNTTLYYFNDNDQKILEQACRTAFERHVTAMIDSVQWSIDTIDRFCTPLTDADFASQLAALCDVCEKEKKVSGYLLCELCFAEHSRMQILRNS